MSSNDQKVKIWNSKMNLIDQLKILEVVNLISYPNKHHVQTYDEEKVTHSDIYNGGHWGTYTHTWTETKWVPKPKLPSSELYC